MKDNNKGKMNVLFKYYCIYLEVFCQLFIERYYEKTYKNLNVAGFVIVIWEVRNNILKIFSVLHSRIAFLAVGSFIFVRLFKSACKTLFE